jgi:antitoxin PrlF
MDVRARLTSKGQVTIPKSVREALQLQEGDELLFRVERSRALVAKTEDFLEQAGTVQVPSAKRGIPLGCGEVDRERIADLMRAAIALPAIVAVDPELLLRALEVYERDRLDFAETYLVAQAEGSGVAEILCFDPSIDRTDSVTRREP